MQQITITKSRTAAITGTISSNMIDRFTAFLDVSPKTVETYARALKSFFRWLSAQGIDAPARDDVLAYRLALAAAGKQANTINIYMAAVRVFFAWTEAEGLYPDVAAKVKGVKISRVHKKDYLTASQARDIIRTIDPRTERGLRDLALFVITVTCGLRTIEAARADVGDLTTAGGHTVLAIQGKGFADKGAFVKIDPAAEKILRRYLQHRGKLPADAPLFASVSNQNAGQRMTTRAISGTLKACMQAAGYDSTRLTAHSLRHTAVTLALIAGRDLAEVQEFARHANISTTMIYNHALDQERNGCAAAISEAIFSPT